MRLFVRCLCFVLAFNFALFAAQTQIDPRGEREPWLTKMALFLADILLAAFFLWAALS